MRCACLLLISCLFCGFATANQSPTNPPAHPPGNYFGTQSTHSERSARDHRQVSLAEDRARLRDAFRASKLAGKIEGKWENIQDNQNIVLLLDRDGGSRWKVTVGHRTWSDLAGSWYTSGENLVLQNNLGQTEFEVTLGSTDELVLRDVASQDAILPLRFYRLD